MRWDGIKRVITLKKLLFEFEETYKRFYKHCESIEMEILSLNKYLNGNNIDYNKFIFDYEQIIFKNNGFSAHVLELLKITKDYLYGIKNEYDEYITLDIENFKHKRRHFKKHNKEKINKIFSKLKEYKANRNIMVHDCSLELNTYILENKDDIYKTLYECKEILKQIYSKCDELEERRYEKKRIGDGQKEIKVVAKKLVRSMRYIK